MQVVILAGGLGTRISAVEPDLPKSLIRIGGRPFIDRQIDLLAGYELRDLLLCVGHGGDRVEAHVGDGNRWGMRVRYAREEPGRLLGTGGALVGALPQLAERFLVMYGDSYLPTDYGKVVRAFEQGGHQAMMCVFKNDGQWDRSNVRVAGGKVSFYAKSAREGEADYIDYGLSAFRRHVIEKYGKAPLPLDLARIQGDMVACGRMAAFEVSERFYEIGKPEGLRELRVLFGSKA